MCSQVEIGFNRQVDVADEETHVICERKSARD